tara:strand:+ start:1122 stop:1658 length:537 start_codon:yes stop_codon:yes gene_type:complete
MIKNIKLIIFVFVGLFVFFVFLNALEKNNNYLPDKVSNEIQTNFTAKLLYENKEVSLQKLIENKELAIINIWASWCLPCREEHSYLLNLNLIKSANVIGINYKDSEFNAKKFLKELGNPYSQILLDPDGTRSIELGAYGVPETFLLNTKSKKIIKKYIGPLDDIKFNEIIKIIKNEKI